MLNSDRSHDAVVMRVVNFLGSTVVIIVISLSAAPYFKSSPDGNYFTAMCTLAGSVFGFLGGLLTPTPRGRREDAVPVVVEQPEDSPVPTVETAPDEEKV